MAELTTSQITESSESSAEEIVGKAAADYVKLSVKIAAIEKELKLLKKQQSDLKEVFKAHRTGEVNEILKVRYKKARYNIIFKDVVRQILDQSAVKAEYALLGKALPMKPSTSTSYEVIRA